MFELFAATTISKAIATLLGVCGLYGLIVLFRPKPDDSRVEELPVRWSPLEAVTVVVGIYIFAQVVASVILYSYWISTHGGSDASMDAFTASSAMQYINIAIVDVVSVGLVYRLLRLRKVKWASIGWVRPRLRDTWYAALGFVVYALLLALLTDLVSRLVPGIDMNGRQELGFDTYTAGKALIPIFISLVILPPLVEETLARGVLYAGLRTRLSFIVSAIITSALFGLAHILGGQPGTLLWVAVIDMFTLSMVMCYVREKTGSLWPSIGMHVIKNGLAFYFLFIRH